jgi:hypothetical protein
VRSEVEKAASKAKAAAKKAQVAVRKASAWASEGQHEQTKATVTLTPESGRITAMLDALLQLIAGFIPLTYLVLDGHFGHHGAG